jgi:cellobiose-specific phosphotransferase system component IIC
MKWLSILSQLFLQFGMNYSAQQRQIQEAPEKIKGMSVQAAVYFVGLVFLIAFTLASIIMIFINLGTQWDSDTPAHFNGTITAAILLFVLGVIAFFISMGLAKYLARKNELQTLKNESARASAKPEINPLIVFGEEFLKQLLANLNKPGAGPE